MQESDKSQDASAAKSAAADAQTEPTQATQNGRAAKTPGTLQEEVRLSEVGDAKGKGRGKGKGKDTMRQEEQPKATTDAQAENSASQARKTRPFPAGTFEDSLQFATAMFKFGSGTRVRRVSFFDHLGKKPDSGPSRQMITNASKYGLLSGSYKSEYLDLTPEGLKCVSTETDVKEQTKSQVKLAIQDIEPFNWLYEDYKSKALPAQQALRDLLEAKGIAEEWLNECVDTFIGNVKFLRLLKVLSGVERIITVEHLLDDLPVKADSAVERTIRQSTGRSTVLTAEVASDFARTCFYVSPIGNEDSEERKHSDLFLNFIVAPALEEFNLSIVRADQIGQGGMITRQVIEHLVRSKLVIADLSYHNPNVFYELAIRHACRLPTVQIIREGDKIPFDLDQIRTVIVDNSSIYSLVPQMETYKSQIANQVRKALEDGESAENPISTFFPDLKVTLP